MQEMHLFYTFFLTQNLFEMLYSTTNTLLVITVLQKKGSQKAGIQFWLGITASVEISYCENREGKNEDQCTMYDN